MSSERIVEKRKDYKDNFEDIYMRLEYFKRCDKLDGRFVKEYAPIVGSTARIMYDKLHYNYAKVGFDKEDILSITNIYMLIYMSLYSLRFNKKKADEYIKKYKHKNHRKPTKIEIYNKDKNNLINFLRQKLQHCCTVCSRKARNITVGVDKSTYFAFTKDSVAASESSITENHKNLGYRIVTIKEFKESTKKAKLRREMVVTDKDGFKIITIKKTNTGLNCEDYRDIVQGYGSKWTQNPEQAYMEAETSVAEVGYKERFLKMSPSVRRAVLNKFIENNKDKKYLKTELTYAYKILRKPKLMV